MNEAAIALNRFGLGGRAGERAPADPRRWLKEQLRQFRPEVPGLDRISTLDEVFVEPHRGSTDADREVMRARRQDVKAASAAMYRAMVSARADMAVASNTPFADRLVYFWANHFAVSTDNYDMRALAGLLEFEAIRPNLMGSFADMLLAVETHPAMLRYLDQDRSVGPESRLANAMEQRDRTAGLNENLAREILELHTLGVNGGYSQADVIEFAKALTGWTSPGVARSPLRNHARDLGPIGSFQFVDRAHEPGRRNIMGKSYDEQGVDQGRAILRDLAAHRATARHIATKLARHFAGDNPPDALVGRLEQSFLSDGGSLPDLYEMLVDAPEVWVENPVRFRSPWEWTIAAIRAIHNNVERVNPLGLTVQLGQPTWQPESPAGFPDTDAHWEGPQALMSRVEVAERLAQQQSDPADPRQLADALFSGSVSDNTSQWISRAESNAQGLALLLVSPEFLRR